MGLATTFVITLACAATWMLEHWLLLPFDLGYLRILTFILVIAATVQFVEMVVKNRRRRCIRHSASICR
jgi:electron transport complex protein RnfA